MVDIDQERFVDTEKMAARQRFFQCQHCLMDRDGPFSKMKFGVILHAFGIAYIRPGDLDKGITLPHKEHVVVGSRFLQRFAPLYKLLIGFGGSLKESLEYDGFEEVVYGLQTEALQGIFGIGGNEDAHGRSIERVQKIDTIEVGHINVQKHQVNISLL